MGPRGTTYTVCGGKIRRTLLPNPDGKVRMLRAAAWLPTLDDVDGILIVETRDKGLVYIYWEVPKAGFADLLASPLFKTFARIVRGKDSYTTLDHWPTREDVGKLGLQTLLDARDRLATKELPRVGAFCW